MDQEEDTMSGIWRAAAVTFMTIFTTALALASEGGGELDIRDLTPDEEAVIVHGGTERPFTGEYVEHFEDGTYHCRRCGAALYNAEAKFRANCGWPAFEAEIEGAVEHRPDADGFRTEIVCATCSAHLGHVFEGERYTETDTRHCVNSISLDFVPVEMPTETAVFAGGCFWGVESAFKSIDGVIETTVGYTGGSTENPDYSEVCSGTTGHAEAVQVVFDPNAVSFEELARLFFEVHDPTSINCQGLDFGSQYRSAIYTADDLQRETVEALIEELYARGYRIVTQVEPVGTFWSAEEYHQDYYERQGGGLCHMRVNRFGD